MHLHFRLCIKSHTFAHRATITRPLYTYAITCSTIAGKTGDEGYPVAPFANTWNLVASSAERARPPRGCTMEFSILCWEIALINETTWPLETLFVTARGRYVGTCARVCMYVCCGTCEAHAGWMYMYRNRCFVISGHKIGAEFCRIRGKCIGSRDCPLQTATWMIYSPPAM